MRPAVVRLASVGMTYLQAAQLAESAKSNAHNAAARFEDQGDRQLAQAVAQLSAAVAEMAKTLHRDSD